MRYIAEYLEHLNKKMGLSVNIVYQHNINIDRNCLQEIPGTGYVIRKKGFFCVFGLK